LDYASILYRNGINEIEKAVKSQSSFSNGLEDILRIEITKQKAYPQNWLEVPVGHSGIHLEWAFHGVGRRDSFEVGLHFERQSQEENKRLFDFFEEQEFKEGT